MRDYFIRRLLIAIPTLLLITIIVFLMLRFIPGSVLELMLNEMSMEMSWGDEEATIEILKEKLGLDAPLYTQYGRYMGVWPQKSGEFAGVVQGNLGTSLWSTEPVRDSILRRFPVSLELGGLAILLAWFIGLPIGIYSAIRQDTIFDYGGRSLALIWVAAPAFWLATMVVVYPSIWWGWTPSIVYIPFAENPAENLIQFIIPAFIMGAGMSGGIARYTRTWLLEVLRQDYIRTAWSKGLTERTVMVRHALRNAIIPLITIIGMEVPRLVGGQVVLEQIFVLPGVGRLFVQALNQRDYPLVSGVNLCVASIVVFMNIFIDLSYAYFDPRIRYK